jgi:hypothetical protein
MRKVAPLILVLSVAFTSVAFDAGPTCCACLPDGIKPTDPVSYLMLKPGIRKGKQFITVGEKLAELRARCRKGKLVDRTGREIRFFQMTGCWGNPPEGYQEILDEQTRELSRLKKRYTVIELSCNSGGLLIN